MKEEQTDIIDLHDAFKGSKNYAEKLRLFDQHFTLIPFSFPPFDEHLNFLLQPDGINLLTEILEKERRKNFTFSKINYRNNMEVVFDVTPHNSQALFFNEYIITKFTCNDTKFNNLLQGIETTAEIDKELLNRRIVDVSIQIETIKEKIENNKDRTFRKQIFKVFYSGYLDCIEGKIKKFPHKKKFIELYLYSSGILFAKYKETLLKEVYKTNSIGIIKSKVWLLHELGVTQFLEEKYKKLIK